MDGRGTGRRLSLVRSGADAATAALSLIVLGPLVAEGLFALMRGVGPEWVAALPVAVGFVCFAAAGLFSARASSRARGRRWFEAVTIVAVVAAVVVVTPLAGVAYWFGPPVIVSLLTVGMAITPEEIAGQEPRRWWRATLVAITLSAALCAVVLGAASSSVGFRRVPEYAPGLTVSLGAVRWQPTQALAAALSVLAVVSMLGAVVLTLTALTQTRCWAQAQIDASRPPAPPYPAPPIRRAVAPATPRDPDDEARAWAAVGPRTDDDLLRR